MTYPISDWVPAQAAGGTEIIVEQLKNHIPNDIKKIDLNINLFNPSALSEKPLVVWLHHDIDQQAVQWCRNPFLVSKVRKFVFVSYWQMNRYIEHFHIPSQKCTVIKHAVSPSKPRMETSFNRAAYISTPFRGLDILLEAWEKLSPDIELHIWSSFKLYGVSDDPYTNLYKKAENLRNVFYRGIVPNQQIRKELQSIDLLVYPNTFAETSCLAVLEAMSAGCRVICPAFGALPETTAGFARLYPYDTNRKIHVDSFFKVVKDEIDNPWEGQNLFQLEQQYCNLMHSWDSKSKKWVYLINRLTSK